MKIFFDNEFIEDGRTIDLISIGMVREDGAQFYMESSECDLSKADDWVKENVIPNLKLSGNTCRSRYYISQQIIKFVGPSPEFWAYYAAYDWVALCQLYGKMIDLPEGWPMYCNDLKQFIDHWGIEIKQDDSNHNALDDAIWLKNAAYEAGVCDC